MTILSACFAGPRASKMPYKDTSAEYDRLEVVLKAEIMTLVRIGVSEFYIGGQTGIDTLAALLVLQIKEEIGTTARLHLVLPYKGMQASLSIQQWDDFEWIEQRADTVTALHKEYVPGCYRERNRYMVERSDYLIAVAGKSVPHSGTHMTIDMAKRKGIDIAVIDPVSFVIKRETARGRLIRF
jgi:Uncharacterized protein conserved in bacteria